MMFYDYENMDLDPYCSAVLDIYAEESGLEDEQENTLTISSEKDDIVEILENLFFDILNVNFNFFP